MIKGNKFGITLVLDKDMDFDKLCEQIKIKFQESAKFFDSSAQMAIRFEGRELETKEQSKVIDIINKCCELNISYIIDQDTFEEQLFAAQLVKKQEEAGDDAKEMDEKKAEQMKEAAAKVQAKVDKVDVIPKHAEDKVVGSIDNQNVNVISTEVNDDLGHFYRGTLRSGQSIEFASSIVVIGDVNPGAKVVAKGNIIVIGSLKGAAYAGVGGSKNAFIIALDMDPMQLRIGDLYARSPDAGKGLLKKRKQPTKEMQIAFVEGNNIYIEPINRAVLNSII